MAVEGLYPELWVAVDCATSQAPAAVFAECAEQVEQTESQIHGVLICDVDATDPTAPATAAGTDLASWELAIDNATAGKWKKLDVIGDLAEAEQSERLISKKRKKKSNKTFTLNFDVDDTNDTNYSFMIQMEQAPVVFMYYYDDDYLYGPVRSQIIRANAPKARGEGSYDAFLFTAEWQHPHHPPRVANVFTI